MAAASARRVTVLHISHRKSNGSVLLTWRKYVFIFFWKGLEGEIPACLVRHVHIQARTKNFDAALLHRQEDAGVPNQLDRGGNNITRGSCRMQNTACVRPCLVQITSIGPHPLIPAALLSATMRRDEVACKFSFLFFFVRGLISLARDSVIGHPNENDYLPRQNAWNIYIE